MPNKIILKKSSVAAKVPTTSDLDYGELALNYADGKLYYKTSSNTISSISGSGGGSSGSSQINRQNYTATSGQTTFSINYTVPNVDVYVNGVHLSDEDYTATTGTSITLTDGCTAGDQVDLIGIVSVTVGAGTSALTIGTGLSGTSYDGTAATTIAIDSTVVTLTGTQTLTNKTLTSPTINSGVLNGTVGATTPSTGAFTTLSTTESADAASFGADLVTNGSFTGSATGWTLGTSWAYGTNNVILTLSAVAEGTLSQNITVASGTSYLVTFTQTQSVAHNGGVQVAIGSYSSSVYPTISSTTTAVTVSLVIDVVTGGSLALTFTPTDQLSTGTVTLDDISVKAITTVSSSINLKNSSSTTTVEFRNPSSAGSTPTFIGYDSGRCYVSGTVASFGNGSGRNLTATSNTVLLGSSAGSRMTTASNTTVIGANALQNAYTGTSNIAIGNNVMQFAANSDNNIAIGPQAMAQVTSATNNVAVGYRSMRYITSGSSNVSLGSADTTPGAAVGGALGQVTTGNNNTAIGTQALASNTTASNNTAVGYQAAYSNTTGTTNTALGYSALRANSTGGSNTAIGYLALYSNNTDQNTAVGLYAAYQTTVAGVTAFGANVLQNNLTGAHNSVFGGASAGAYNAAMYSNTTGSGNCAFGTAALTANTTGGYNVAMGLQSLASNTTASNNTAVGYQAGYSNQTGATNTFVGLAAGYSNTGSNNSFIGGYTGYSNLGGASNVAIGCAAPGGAGYFTFYANQSGNYNVAIGAAALKSNTSGSGNISIGMYSMGANLISDYNTAVGYSALGLVTGGTNTGIGYNSGSGITTGAKNVVIGSYTGAAAPISATGSNFVVLSDGDGNVRAYWNGANATFNGALAVTGNVSATGSMNSTRINSRVSSTATATSVTPDVSAYDQYCYTALASALAINAPTGTPLDGNKIMFRILDNGTARALTWDATYTAIGTTLPTTTTANKTTYVGCLYNSNNTRWDVIAVVTQG